MRLHREEGILMTETAQVDPADRNVARDLTIGGRAIRPENPERQEQDGDRDDREKRDTWLHGYLGITSM